MIQNVGRPIVYIVGPLWIVDLYIADFVTNFNRANVANHATDLNNASQSNRTLINFMLRYVNVSVAVCCGQLSLLPSAE